MDKQSNEIEHYVWAERIADELAAKKKKEYVLHGMWTPSGFFHIGNSRAELMIPHFVAKALGEKGIKSRQNFIVDDFDDFDKIPAGVNVDKEEFSKYLGMPLREVPSPVEGHESWAHYFRHEVISAMDDFGIKPNILSSYDSYKKGLYDEAIKIVLDKAEKAREIWNEITNAKKPKGWLPVMVVCENCGKSCTTKAISWDGTYIEYTCNQEKDYAKPCRHKGRVKPEKGAAKLPWRLHWAAGWYIHKVTFESAGKDHHSAGGSVQTSQAFIKEIFNSEGPMQPLTEFLLLDNAKLSGSSGNVISLRDWLQFAEPELLRFMMASYKPSTVINFDLHSNKFFLLADRFDNAEKAYFSNSEEKRDRQLTEIYKYAQITIPKEMPAQLNYSNAVMIVQTFPNKKLDEIIEKIHASGWIQKKILMEYDKARLEKRLRLARNWLGKYAPEDVKFTVQNDVPESLKLLPKEKEALHLLAASLEKKEWDEQSLFNEFYNICEETGIKNTDFFRAAYNVLLNKDRGPKLAPFILTLGREKAISLFEKV